MNAGNTLPQLHTELAMQLAEVCGDLMPSVSDSRVRSQLLNLMPGAAGYVRSEELRRRHTGWSRSAGEPAPGDT